MLKKITCGLLAMLPLAVWAHSGPIVKESCGMGNDCAYNIAGHSHRVITLTQLKANSTYLCNTEAGDGFNNLVVDNIVPSDSGTHVGLNSQSNLTSNPFMIITTGQSDNETVQFNLRNIDMYFLNHHVVYRCEKQAS